MTSRGIKTKLSKHLLEMKFMKRSALRIEKEAHEEEQQQQIDEEHWMLDIPELKEKDNQYVIQPSYVHCENLRFGRMAFKGFNPEIEKLMKQMDTDQDLAMAEEREKEQSVSDAEMADRYASLVSTIGKKFNRKRKWGEDSSDSGEEIVEIVKVSRPAVKDSEKVVGDTLAQMRREFEASTSSSKNALPQITSKAESVQQSLVSEVQPIEVPSGAHSTMPVMAMSDTAASTSSAISVTDSKKKSKSVLDYYNKKKKQSKNADSKGFLKPS